MPDLKEHFELILWLVGTLFSLLIACLGYIGRQFSREMQTDRDQRERVMNDFAHKIDKIEGYLQNITEELFERMRKAEASLCQIWAEHRVIKEIGTCALGKHHHERSEDGQ